LTKTAKYYQITTTANTVYSRKGDQMANVRQGYLQLNDNCECTTMFFDTTKGMQCKNISYTVTRNTALIWFITIPEMHHNNVSE